MRSLATYKFKGYAGIYIMQNTMVGGGEWPTGKKIKIRRKRGKKKGKITLKKGGKGLKNASFWNSNPPAAILFIGKRDLKRGGGGEIKCIIYIPAVMRTKCFRQI